MSLSCLRIFLLATVLVLSGCAELDPGLVESVLGGISQSQPLDEATVARGLREALRIGSGRAIERVGRLDGFLANELIRVRLPEELEKMADVLRKVGFRRQVDELEVAMNRAAEQAAGEALDIFVTAIRDMTIADAFGILRGGDTAATDYLRGRTTETLRQRFEPILAHKMEKVGLYRTYNRLADTYNDLPFTSRPAVDLESYLTERALYGLFTTLAEEETRIREDPVARTTRVVAQGLLPRLSVDAEVIQPLISSPVPLGTV